MTSKLFKINPFIKKYKKFIIIFCSILALFFLSLFAYEKVYVKYLWSYKDHKALICENNKIKNFYLLIQKRVGSDEYFPDYKVNTIRYNKNIPRNSKIGFWNVHDVRENIIILGKFEYDVEEMDFDFRPSQVDKKTNKPNKYSLDTFGAGIYNDNNVADSTISNHAILHRKTLLLDYKAENIKLMCKGVSLDTVNNLKDKINLDKQNNLNKNKI